MKWGEPAWLAARGVLETVRFLIQFMVGGTERSGQLSAGRRMGKWTGNVDGFYYGYIIARGREFLSDTLQSDDPFNLPPAEIVEHVISVGYGPNLEHERRLPFPTQGKVDTVARDNQCFIVAVDPVAETISVQEVRADPYEPK